MQRDGARSQHVRDKHAQHLRPILTGFDAVPSATTAVTWQRALDDFQVLLTQQDLSMRACLQQLGAVCRRHTEPRSHAEIDSMLRAHSSCFIRERILKQWVDEHGGPVTADLVLLVITGLPTYADRARIVKAHQTALNADVFYCMLQAEDTAAHAEDVRDCILHVEPVLMAPILRVPEVHQALIEVVRSPWWIQGAHPTLEASLCAACGVQLEEYVPVNHILKRHNPRVNHDPSMPHPVGPRFFSNREMFVKVLYIGDVQRPTMTRDDARRAAAASIEACTTDFVVNKMQWQGRSFGLIVGTHSYICVSRSRLEGVNTLQPNMCARFFLQFGLSSGISHNDPHAGNVGRRTADGELEAFDFERSTLITESHPSPVERDLTAYAQAVRDGNTELSKSLCSNFFQRAGLDDVMNRFTRMWMTPVTGYAAAFTCNLLQE